MTDEYIRKQDAIDLINKISNLDLKAKGGICVSLANLGKADVVPVVHGEWLPTNDENKKRCNKCDTVVLIAMYPNGNANFCPNCGAKMDARSEQDG